MEQTVSKRNINKENKILEVKNLNIAYGEGKNKFLAVKNASFHIYQGETFGLVGESGSGKTTIGRAVMRILPTCGGDIIYDGDKINGKIPKALDKKVIKEVQMIFQDPMASLNERAKIDYIVGEGLKNLGVPKNERHQMVIDALLKVGLLPEFSSRFPHEFSGGQRQRIGIARALVMNPKLIVADEPISALDVSIRAQVLNLLAEMQRESGLTYLFIAHDLSVMRYITDRIAVIYKGEIVELAETEELFKRPLHPYTRSLLSAIPVPDPKIEKDKKLITFEPERDLTAGVEKEWIEVFDEHYVFGANCDVEKWKDILEQDPDLLD
ncbi:MAG: ABC transporter ATP-binding protein [Ruminococcaceae bacterium]|nr:ABC transporter ATP-binding protein [Oscillospiraceae bacterium]